MDGRVAYAALKHVGLVAAMAASLSACAGLQAGSPSSEPMPGATEAIHAAAFTQDQAVFWVSSNGCTTRDNLLPLVTRLGDHAVITLRRLSEDTCDSPREGGLRVKWTFEELGLPLGTSITVNNPYLIPAT